MLRRLPIRVGARAAARALSTVRRGRKPATELEQHISDWMAPFAAKNLSPRWFRSLRRDIALRWTGTSENSPGMIEKQTLLNLVSDMEQRGMFEELPTVREAIRVRANPAAKSPEWQRPTVCFHCGSPDHWRAECPELGRAPRDKPRPKAVPTPAPSVESGRVWEGEDSGGSNGGGELPALRLVRKAPAPAPAPAPSHPYTREPGDSSRVDEAKVHELLTRRWRLRKKVRRPHHDDERAACAVRGVCRG